MIIHLLNLFYFTCDNFEIIIEFSLILFVKNLDLAYIL